MLAMRAKHINVNVRRAAVRDHSVRAASAIDCRNWSPVYGFVPPKTRKPHVPKKPVTLPKLTIQRDED